MGAVCAYFHWQPAQFWSATPHEIVAMLEAAESTDG